VDEAAKILGAESRTAAVHMAFWEVVALCRFRKLMKQYANSPGMINNVLYHSLLWELVQRPFW
jgi:hypothetical protein